MHLVAYLTIAVWSIQAVGIEQSCPKVLYSQSIYVNGQRLALRVGKRQGRALINGQDPAEK